MAYDPQVLNVIVRTAKKYGLDPRAVVSVALGEGGLSWGAIGDAGTSFGPFQLHVGGALPRGKDAAWANSPEGVDYAIRQMAAAGASGLTGPAAINAIVRKFERPADPDSSVRNAVARYQSGDIPKIAGSPIASLAGPSPTTPTGLPTELMQPDPKQAAISLLGDLATNKPFNPLEALTSLATQRRQASMMAKMAEANAATTVPGAPAASPTTPPGASYSGSWTGGPTTASAKKWSQLSGIGNMSPNFMLTAIKKAQAMGLHVGENPYLDPVDPVHVSGSFHNQNFQGGVKGKTLGRAIDISGDPKAMDAFFRWAIRYRPTELFYDPLGQYDSGRYSTRGIGNHSDHVHLSV